MATCSGSPLTVEQQFSPSDVVLEGCSLVEDTIAVGETTDVEFTITNGAGVQVQVEFELVVGPRVMGGTETIAPNTTRTVSREIANGLGAGQYDVTVEIRNAVDVSAPGAAAAARPSVSAPGSSCGCCSGNEGVGARLRERTRLGA